jgi:hypothetical protein
MIKEVSTLEMLVNLYQMARLNVQEDSHIQTAVFELIVIKQEHVKRSFGK